MDEWSCLPRNRAGFQSCDCVNCHPGRNRERGHGGSGGLGELLKSLFSSVGEEFMAVVLVCVSVSHVDLWGVPVELGLRKALSIPLGP